MTTLVFDTETTGLWKFNKAATHPEQPDMVQLAAVLYDDDRREVSKLSTLIKMVDGREVEPGAERIHGISTARANALGITTENACHTLNDMIKNADHAVAHNIKFDLGVVRRAFTLLGAEKDPFRNVGLRCTMLTSTNLVKIPSRGKKSGYKWPKLGEAYFWATGTPLVGAHDALVDVEACAEIYFNILDEGISFV